MSNYTQTTNFATKDALASGNPLKVVKGTEINTEFANIATAIATKLDDSGVGVFTTLSVSGVSTLSNVVLPVIDNIKLGYSTTATAAGTTTLTSASNNQQFFTGTTTQTVVLPVTSTLALGLSYLIVNNSTGVVTVQSSGANTITLIPANTAVKCTCILISGTTAASWSFSFEGSSNTPYKQIPTLTASIASNALTIGLNACSLDFRSDTLGSGTVTTVSGTPASLIISSGSTLGTVSAVASRIVVIAINNAGTIELAVVNSSGSNILDESTLISTTAEGGVGTADSASVIYSTTARTSVSYRVLGYIESTQATAGNWATSPSTIQGNGGQASISLAMNARGLAPMFASRAWVNFNGTGTVAIRGSGNVSSITDSGTGDYTVNFTNAISDGNYCASCTSIQNTMAGTQDAAGMTTTTCRVRTLNDAGTVVDRDFVGVAIFR